MFYSAIWNSAIITFIIHARGSPTAACQHVDCDKDTLNTWIAFFILSYKSISGFSYTVYNGVF